MKRLLPCVASLIIPGLGQLWCACPVRGFVMALVFWCLVAVEKMGLVFAFAPLSFGLYASVKLAVILVKLAVAVDAWVLARDAAPDKRPCPAVFAVFITLVLLANAVLLWARVHLVPRTLEIHFPSTNQSMAPAIAAGDVVVVQTGFSRPAESGDLVYLVDPEVSVRRVIGTPGDLVSIDRGNVIRDAKTLTEPYIKERAVGDMVATMVLDGRYFVLADNRTDPDAHDSRTYGSVAASALRGRPAFILWSSDLHRIGQRLK